MLTQLSFGKSTVYIRIVTLQFHKGGVYDSDYR